MAATYTPQTRPPQGSKRWGLDDDWRSRAACASVDPDLFFPVGVTGPAVDQIASAKAVCATCPVQHDCLDFAITTNQEYGIWGATSEEERRILRRAWRRSQARSRQGQAAS